MPLSRRDFLAACLATGATADLAARTSSAFPPAGGVGAR